MSLQIIIIQIAFPLSCRASGFFSYWFGFKFTARVASFRAGHYEVPLWTVLQTPHGCHKRLVVNMPKSFSSKKKPIISLRSR